MDVALIVLATLVITVVAVGGALFASRRAPLDLVDHLILDEGGRYVHVFGQRTYMPDDQDSFSVYHHLLLDLDTLVAYSGDHRRGEDLDLGSPFVTTSMAELAARMGVPLAFGSKRGADREKGPPVVVRKANRTDTEVNKPPPPNGVILWTVSDNPSRFDLEMRRDGQSLLKRRLRGDVEGPWTKRCIVPARKLMLLTYLRERPFSSGVALLVIDTETSTIRSDELLRTGGPQGPAKR